MPANPAHPLICTTDDAENKKFTVDPVTNNVEVRVSDNDALVKLCQIADSSGAGDPYAEIVHVNLTDLGVANVSVPTVAGNDLVEVLVHNTSTASTENILVSFDGGTTFKTVFQRDSVRAKFLESGVTQIIVKGSVATADCEILLQVKL